MKRTPHKIKLAMNSILAVVFTLAVIVLLETSRSGMHISIMGY